MKHLLLIIFIAFSCSVKAAYTDSVKLYNPNANAEADIKAAIAAAKMQGKHVLIQAGGNWCSWCIRFNKFVTSDTQLDSAMNENYIVYHLNYSSENKNKAIFAKYGFAQRFGFPVFIILDGNGNRLHTQNSGYLEEGHGYNKQKVMDFFTEWTPASINPANYINY